MALNNLGWETPSSFPLSSLDSEALVFGARHDGVGTWAHLSALMFPPHDPRGQLPCFL